MKKQIVVGAWPASSVPRTAPSCIFSILGEISSLL
jgi:hypothetical protein